MIDEPTGVVGIFTWPDGAVLASVSDFDRSTYGGFSLSEGQAHRVKERLAYEVIEKTCNECIAKALSAYHRSEIIGHLVRKQGFKIFIIEIPTVRASETSRNP